MEKEIWKDIPGYEGYYQASNLGRIKSVERDVICNNITYESISDCAKAYSVNRTTLYNWLNGKHTMPQKFQDLGLRYA